MTVAEFLKSLDVDESWARVQDSDIYEVSSWGRVRGPRKMLQPAVVRGYEVVSLHERGVTINHRIHRLVASAFLGPAPFEDALIAHNDGDPRNNRVSNIRWASALENQADRHRHGTRLCGTEVAGAKLTDDAVRAIRARLARGERYPSIAADFGVSISSISLINKGRTWKHV